MKGLMLYKSLEADSHTFTNKLSESQSLKSVTVSLIPSYSKLSVNWQVACFSAQFSVTEFLIFFFMTLPYVIFWNNLLLHN